MFDHFGLLAPFYEFFIKPKFPDTLVELAGLPVDGPLLDAGGGTGRISQFLTDLAGQVVLADLSPKMLAQSLTKPGLKSTVSHTENLPFPEATFERIIMIDALHHVCDQAVTAGELWRTLKPGGMILIEEPNADLWMVKIVAWAEKAALMRSHFLTPEEIKKLFQPFPAQIEIVREDHLAWVMIHKPAGG